MKVRTYTRTSKGKMYLRNFVDLGDNVSVVPLQTHLVPSSWTFVAGRRLTT